MDRAQHACRFSEQSSCASSSACASGQPFDSWGMRAQPPLLRVPSDSGIAVQAKRQRLGEGGAASDEAGVPGRCNAQASPVRLLSGRDQSDPDKLINRCESTKIAHRVGFFTPSSTATSRPQRKSWLLHLEHSDVDGNDRCPRNAKSRPVPQFFLIAHPLTPASREGLSRRGTTLLRS